MTYDKPIVIQRIDEATEEWSDQWPLHCKINKSSGTEYVNAGADISRATKTFEMRWFPDLADVDYNRGLYRIIYRDHAFNIVDYDDYMEKHQTVKIKAESYGD